MLLDLSRMRGGRDHFDRTYKPSAFEASEDYKVIAPVVLTFDVLKKNAEITLVGHLTTTLELQCGRCLEPMKLPVNADFDLMYLPHSENAGEGEVEIEDDDLDTAFYKDEMIDLGQLMREQFYLALPMKPLCAEDCKGLCPQCGTNLNQGTCNCAESWTDPRLETLKTLKGLFKDNG